MFIIEKFDTLDSTNKYAIQLVSDNNSGYSIDNKVIIAYNQISGVGKQGVTWYSYKGNLAATLIIAYQRMLNENNVGDVSLLSALSVLKALQEYVLDTDKLRLKWPNDVLYDGKKIAGILIDIASSLDNKKYFIIGCGVNLKKAPNNVQYPVECLSNIISKEISVNDFLEKMLFYFQDYIVNIPHKDIKKEWLSYAYKLANQITIETSKNTYISGIFVGITNEGYIALKVGNEIKKISAGKIIFEESYNI